MYSFKCFSNVDILFRFNLRGSCGGSLRGSRSGLLSVSPSNRSCWSGLICLSGAGGTRVSGFGRCSSSGYLSIFSCLNLDISVHFVFPSFILFAVTIVPLIFVITYTYCSYGVYPSSFLV